MGLDFSALLLNYSQRIFLKRTDIVNLLISLIAIFVAFDAIIIVQPTTIWYKISLIGLTGFGILLTPYVTLKLILKMNNEKIFNIERIIIQNYDNINERDHTVKEKILDQFQSVITKGLRSEKEVKKLIDLLSQSASDEPKATKRSWWDWFWNGGER